MPASLSTRAAAAGVAALLAAGWARAEHAAAPLPMPSLLPAAHASPPPRAHSGPVIPGLEVLLRDSLHLVRGKRVGLITNHTAVTSTGRSAIDLLHEHPEVRLAALFGPEHGIRGTIDGGERIGTQRDARTEIGR